jgi:hypothetical protein
MPFGYYNDETALTLSRILMLDPRMKILNIRNFSEFLICFNDCGNCGIIGFNA